MDVLEELLKEANQGRIIAFSFAAVEQDDVTHEGFCGDVDQCAVRLFGAINILRDAYFHAVIEHHSTADMGDV